MKLQFTHQDYQQRAVDAVVKVFAGQPSGQSIFSLYGQSSSTNYAADGSIGNSLVLDDEHILNNLQKVQLQNGLEISNELIHSKINHSTEICGNLDFSIEMETGTGKTYVFLKTIFELNKIYGFKKFVIVVPSVAIREGTMKAIEVTKSHFSELYQNVPCVSILFNSDKLNDLKHFAQNDALSVIVINIDSFAKESTRIKQKGEKAFAPIDYIQAVNPIVIVDEPQNFETEIRRRALMDLNPLCTLRYSATHKNKVNLLYSLNPVQAYEMGLVKQIEVDGVNADADHNQAYIKLLSIDANLNSISATVEIDINEANGVKRKKLKIKLGDDLYKKSKEREIYKQGYILNEFSDNAQQIEFSSGRILRIGQAQGELTGEVMRFQIERTVANHFARLKKLKPLGIKVLSLFFIDRVANYRTFDEEGNYTHGKFGDWFENAFNKYADMDKYKNLIPYAVAKVHNGYFSGDKKSKSGKQVWIDSSERGSQKDDSTYELIMREKEKLLNLNEPLQFIFSHSALREGWDNPNVFQICTLNESQSALKKRQEIGRGLRLCVNQDGVRIHDKQINILTVIPNSSYESFANSLQKEIEDENGIEFKNKIKNARAKALVKKKNLTEDEEALFKIIWEKINYQTQYSVNLDTDKLINACITLLKDIDQFPFVRPPKIRSLKAKLDLTQDGVRGIEIGVDSIDSMNIVNVPDIYAYIQSRIHLSRTTLFAILDGSGRLKEFLINPQSFLDTTIYAIKKCLQQFMVDGIQYREVNGQRYEMLLFDEILETYLSSVYPSPPNENNSLVCKTILEAQPLDEFEQFIGDPFECVLRDSEPETKFARDCSLDEKVKLFFKLPLKFKINTPLGPYTPDWAVVFDNDKRVYFVAETKSTTIDAELRPAEVLKIKCGQKHFELAEDVIFKKIHTLDQLLT